ncbi:FAD-dependent oxidoreductase [Jonesia denitrificans]|uniref:FAD-dependent pyridine nucleotide-disulphide oxidoreductase n=1 Tax=Jonesia denitrificans (strain ATCC 14870 / DSM 20603 / BCRC 15368 / CIP 55.134 / JCM 11481 / NBRC 15587 / NCTC 10816 / Prevot 55134) TaxID=471856 RepID=C7R5I1_JONDD|nr:FAD-dependent oxidoreductase [Jonesia denitrificans]ACV09254.1 FAD-dependent pyridine nucleotide-disulphide oxidoreductase [Jonesia denitrificans DSM 20603]AVJ53323.1 pyridine nucleotide-disulfide oxidoreductase [Jonesia denitrificans]QXB44025.1 FAD-dependent oxidoreductase [Jonesia denitrificans]SQH21491.1 Coenzyme A disulfide reductase [Jonesia denitrificans]
MKLVVVGGVAAGASIAARARRLDETAEIIVLERGHHISFANCGLPYHIGDVITDRQRLLVQTPQSLRESLNIDARTGHEVIAIDREARTVTVRNIDDNTEYTETYDALALTPGSEPVRPPLPGIDSPNVMVLRRIGDMDRIKQRIDDALEAHANKERGPVTAAVIGAGYIGLEMAENFHHRGVTVNVVEAADQILPPVDREIAVPVENHLRARGIGLHLNTAAAAFVDQEGGRVRVELTNNSSLEADIVILSVGVRPSSALAQAAGLELSPKGGVIVDEHMRTSDPHIWAAGDVVETPHTVLPGQSLFPLAGPANRQGRVAAENICGRSTTYTSTQGTSIVKVFDMVAGGTGATERQLVDAGVAYRAVHVHPSGHAGYYPGTAAMHLKVLFDPESGKLLGAQASGFDGVDKRLDVLATALRLGATVYDLEELELAYAPPFGSAKDPVNMAGFVGANTIRGDLTLWYAQDFPQAVAGAKVVDVRTPEEFDLWHIPGAVNVPLATLRDEVEQWDPTIPVRLYCAVGFRSYLAHRILVQRGFADVRTLSGGSITFRAWHEVEGEGASPQHAEISHAPAGGDPALEKIAAAVAQGPAHHIDLDCTGLACPGPIMSLKKTAASLKPGDEVTVTVSDPGFAHDGPAWAGANGHEILDLTPHGPGYRMTMRMGGAVAPASGAGVVTDPREGMSFVVFSGDLDKVLAAFIIANGALAMDKPVRMFFTFWGLNALRRENPPARDRKALDKMFGAMMPSGPDALKLSTMNMAGAGTAMIKKVMKDHSVSSLPELMSAAIEGGAEITACTMTMDLLGIAESDLIDGVQLGGVATFIAAAEKSGSTLFI